MREADDWSRGWGTEEGAVEFLTSQGREATEEAVRLAVARASG